MENTPARVLIIDTAWVGDVVFTTALLKAAKALWPEATFTLLVAPRAAGIVRGHPMLDELIVYDKAGSEKRIGAFLKLGRRLRSGKFDLVLCAHPSLRSALLTKLSRSPVRVGYEAWWASSCFTHTCMNDLSVEPFHVERRLNLLRALDIPVEDPGVHIPISNEKGAVADHFLENDSAPFLGLIPGSAWATKRWPAEKFRALAESAQEKLKARCIIFVGKQDAGLAGVIARELHPKPIIVAGKPLEEVAALLSRCHWVVGNDTGISYLAIATGSPAVRVLYGSTQVNFRFLSPHAAITAGVPCCCPSSGHGKKTCDWGNPPVCMNSIEPEDVLDSF